MKTMDGTRTEASRAATGLMSRPVVAVRADCGLSEALRLLVAHGLRHLAVVDGAGRCRGVLADRAVAAAWARDPLGLDRWRAADVLPAVPAVPAVLDAGATVGEVARFMHHHQVDAVAVVAGEGQPVGIVTATDLINLLAAGPQQDKEREEEQDR